MPVLCIPYTELLLHFALNTICHFITHRFPILRMYDRPWHMLVNISVLLGVMQMHVLDLFRMVLF